MAAVDTLLQDIKRQQGRILLFSSSTQMMDLIENYLQAKGYSHLRMDGSTSSKKREEIISQFKKNSDIFVFLLSTRAMGLGLNLTEANYVIIFDVEWNPTNDEQAQDRAYRIGQTRDVNVFRLVTQGTYEELKFWRQVYKKQLKNETIFEAGPADRASAERTFRGVAGDKGRKGELFGLANLLKFKDGPFMKYISKEFSSRQNEIVVDGDNIIMPHEIDEELEAMTKAAGGHSEMQGRTEQGESKDEIAFAT